MQRTKQYFLSDKEAMKDSFYSIEEKALGKKRLFKRFLWQESFEGQGKLLRVFHYKVQFLMKIELHFGLLRRLKQGFFRLPIQN